MAEDDASVSNLFKEIDDDLRQDRATELWKKYGNTLIAAIVAVVIGVGAFEGWKAIDKSQREGISKQYGAALELTQQQKFAEAQNAFKTLAASEEGGYVTLARLQEAAALVGEGKNKEAAERYFQIAQDNTIEKMFRDMAIVLGAMNGLDTMDAKDISARLQPLIGGANPWRFSAMEIQAFAEAKQGNKAKALELMKALADDAGAPAGMRQRAAEFAKAYAG